jgi:hypothetical protein
MSRLNRKLPSRLAAVLGSACFLGGLTIAAAPVNAGIYVGLLPTVTASTNPGDVLGVSGNIFSGYTLTLVPGTTATVSYDLVYAITDGATQAVATNGALFTARGAIRTASTGASTITAQGGLSYNQSGSQYGYGSQVIRTDQLTGTGGGGKAGTVVANGGNSGVGPQTGTFGNYDGPNAAITADQNRFDIQTSTTTNVGPGNVFAQPLLQGSLTGYTQNSLTAGLAIGKGTFSVTTGAAGDNLTAKVVGGDGANGGNAFNSWAQYYENYSSANPAGNVLASYNNGTSNPLTIVVAAGNTTAGLLKGDLGGGGPDGINPDNSVSGADIDAFTLALVDRPAYLAANPGLTLAQVNYIGDLGGGGPDGLWPDGQFSGADIDAFTLYLVDRAAYLAAQPGPGTVSGVSAHVSSIPEPTSIGLMLPAVAAVARRRR